MKGRCVVIIERLNCCVRFDCELCLLVSEKVFEGSRGESERKNDY